MMYEKYGIFLSSHGQTIMRIFLHVYDVIENSIKQLIKKILNSSRSGLGLPLPNF